MSKNVVSHKLAARKQTARVASLVATRAMGRPQERTDKPHSIVFVAAEVAPYSKTGGLGDVLQGLPIELAKRGHKVMSVAPR